MKMKIQELAKKLTLWHTPTFSPIMSHEELEPILYSVGFVSLPAYIPSQSSTPRASPPATPPAELQWKEYVFPSASAAAAAAASGIFLPRPRLPFPRICGLHLIAYRAFLSALECYIDPSLVYDLFHVRAMPLPRLPDEEFERIYRPMKDDEFNDGKLYVFRRGAIYRCMLEQIEAMENRAERQGEDDGAHHTIRGRSSRHTDEIIMVSLDTLLPDTDNYITTPCPSPESHEN